MSVAPARYASVFELAKNLPSTSAFNRIFEVQQGYPRCKATPQLQQKYGKGAAGLEGHVRHGAPQLAFATSCAVSSQRCAALHPVSGLPAGVPVDNTQHVLRISNRVSLVRCDCSVCCLHACRPDGLLHTRRDCICCFCTHISLPSVHCLCAGTVLVQ